MFDGIEHFVGGAAEAFPGLDQASSNSFDRVQPVRQALVEKRIHDDRFGLAFHGQHQRTARPLEPFHEPGSIPFECGEGVDVLADVDHG